MNATRTRCSGVDGRHLETCPGHDTFGEDCPAWDAHMASADLFVDVDGEDEPTLWRRVDDSRECVPVLRRCDLPAEHRDLWGRLTDGVTA